MMRLFCSVVFLLSTLGGAAHSDDVIRPFELEGDTTSDLEGLVPGDSYFTITLVTASVGRHVQTNVLRDFISRISGTDYYAIPRSVVRVGNRPVIASNLDITQRTLFSTDNDAGRIQVFNRYLVGPVPYGQTGVDVEVALFAAKNSSFITSFLDVTSELIPVLDSAVSIAGVSGSVLSNAQSAAETVSQSIDNLIADSDNGTLLMGYGTAQGELGLLLRPGLTAWIMAESEDHFESREYRLAQAGSSEFELDLETRTLGRNGQFSSWGPESEASYMVLRVDLNSRRSDVEAIPGYSERAEELRRLRLDTNFYNIASREMEIMQKVAEFDAFLRNSPDLTVNDGHRQSSLMIDRNIRYICDSWLQRGLISASGEGSQLPACAQTAFREQQDSLSEQNPVERHLESRSDLEQLNSISRFSLQAMQAYAQNDQFLRGYQSQYTSEQSMEN